MADDNIHELNRFFERIEVRFDAIEARFKKIDERLDALENQIDAVAAMMRRDMVGLQAEFFALSKRVDKAIEAMHRAPLP